MLLQYFYSPDGANLHILPTYIKEKIKTEYLSIAINHSLQRGNCFALQDLLPTLEPFLKRLEITELLPPNVQIVSFIESGARARGVVPGCQMVCFQTPPHPQKIKLGKFWRVLQWKILVYFKPIWSTLLLLEIFYGHLVYFVYFGLFFPVLIYCTTKNLATLE
jgi:hypothetical protein